MDLRRSLPVPGPIYAIADAGALGERSIAGAVAEMAAAGVRTIQVRGKRWSGRQWYDAVESCCRALEGSGAVLWVDDRADVAALFPGRPIHHGRHSRQAVSGVHLGQDDLPPAAARRILGPAPWIGLSTHDERQLAAADADPEVDLIAVGPVFPTTGKEAPDAVVGLDFVRLARAATRKPLVAIGGIEPANALAVLAAGADAAVALGAVCRGDVRLNCRRLLAAVSA
jgi:thiamine-phosphate pyrophosphorylase